MAAIGSRLGQKTAQRQAIGLTPALQQSIKLLELSNQALAELVAEAVAENPLLEWAEEPPAAGRKTAPKNAPPARFSRSPRPLPAGLARLFSGSARQRQAAAGGEATAEIAAGGPSLQDHLLQQLGADVADAGDRAIGRALIEALDEAGYLTAEAGDLAKRLGVAPPQVERVLAKLRQFDPPGVFASDLADCLGLQLADSGRLDGPMTLLLRHLDLLAAGERRSLMKICGVDAARLEAMIGVLRRLDPRPGLAFERGAIAAAIPDVIVERSANGGWSIELVGEPRLLFSDHPASNARDPAAASYLKERRSAARWLLRALDKRSETLLQVVHEIVARQGEFLEGGAAALKPLSRRQIARKLELHESTIGRAIGNKYAATPRGVVALAGFFAGRLAGKSESSGHAPAAVRARLQRLIAGEPAGQPISDEALAGRLRGEGIEVARRTIAKYRQMLRIPAANQRRARKPLQSADRRPT